MQQNEFLKAFIEDCKYYDLENKELKNILKYVNLKNKSLLDIGAGIGRLSFPLAKYAKEVVALEKDKRLAKYWKKHENKKVKFVNQSLESYAKKSKRRKFDIILLAWPTFDSKFIGLIKKFMHKESKFIFITCDNNSDYEKTLSKLSNKKDFKKDIENKKKFIKILPKKFRLTKKRKIATYYKYPNEKIAFKINKNSLQLWFNTKVGKNIEDKLKKIIEEHKKNKQIIFQEEIYFYILKCKS